MANKQTFFAAAQENYSILRNGRPSLRDVQRSVKYAVFTYTADGTELTGDTIELGSLDVEGAEIIPGMSTVQVSSGVTMTNTLKVGATAATSTAATTAVSATTIGAAFAGVTAYPVAVRSDKLFLLTSSTLTLASTKVVTARIAYSSPNL